MKTSKQFLYFIISGGIAALVNFFSRIALNFIFSYEVSIVLAYCFGMLTAYILTRKYVFLSNANIVKSAVKFIIVNLIAVLQTYFISVYLNRYFESINFNFYSKELAHMVGIIVPVFTSYVGHKYYSFK